MENANHVAARFAKLHEERSFLCFPLTFPGKTIQFKDVSLGLPLAIGFTRLLTEKVITGKLVATGGIHLDGTITKVGHLDQKIIKAKSKFDGLLYPFANNVIRKEKKQVLIPVSNFNQAWMFFSFLHLILKKL